METQIAQWEVLTCLACETSTAFLQILELRMKPGMGVVPTIKGYQCQICQAVADVGKLQRKAEITRQQRALAAANAELIALEQTL